MYKEFNLTGWCNEKWHFMADISKKVEEVLQMVYRGKYFIINRPRQYGKTTMLKTVDSLLSKSDEWLVFSTSFEGIGSEDYRTEESFCHQECSKIINNLVMKSINPNFFLQEGD